VADRDQDVGIGLGGAGDQGMEDLGSFVEDRAERDVHEASRRVALGEPRRQLTAAGAIVGDVRHGVHGRAGWQQGGGEARRQRVEVEPPRDATLATLGR
jgi:hypothetical protein